MTPSLDSSSFTLVNYKNHSAGWTFISCDSLGHFQVGVTEPKPSTKLLNQHDSAMDCDGRASSCFWPWCLSQQREENEDSESAKLSPVQSGYKPGYSGHISELVLIKHVVVIFYDSLLNKWHMGILRRESHT